MGESFFASEPRSLRMDRRSPEAARLREAVSKKLLDFLGNYSDEVLAEYIVVLVCNGKHQTQARDDLQAFLGEESGTFVSWLWNYLSEEFFAGVTPDVSDSKAKITTKNNNSLDSEQKTNTPTLTDHHSHSIGPPKVNNGTFEPPSYHANSDHSKPIQVSERLKSWSPHLDDLSAEVNKERLTADEITLHKNSGSKSGNFTGPAKNITSSIKCSHEVASVGKQALHCELQNRKIQKISSSSVPSQHLPEPMAEQAAIGLQSVIAEEHQLRPLPCTIPAETRMVSNAADDLSHPTARLRGNVWDRLGRPHAHTQRSIKEERSFNLDFIDSGKQGEESQNPMLTGISQVASSTRQSYAVDRGDSEGISFKVSGDIKSDKVNNTSSLKRKIEESEFNGAKGNYFQVPNSKATVVSQNQVKKDAEDTTVKNMVPTSTTLPANSKSQRRTVGGNANQKPMQDDMLAVKSRIQQIEMDMLKLRSKQVGRSTDGKPNMSSVQNLSEEGIESRTVLVANVHFAATKESLISHFGKCGTIAKVIMLTDAVTGLPKGAAYLVFANKESVDKAISLSGTSFFSRILKVIRKVEVPPDYLVPSQPSLKQQQQPFYHQPYGKNPLLKPHTSSHLQWRRDQRSSGENSLPAPSNGLGSSNSVE